MRITPLMTAFGICCAANLQAALISGYVASENDLFQNYGTAAQSPNATSSIVASLDISGVGRGLGALGDRHMPLVSPTHVAYAGHFPWGGPLEFYSPALNDMVTYWVDGAAFCSVQTAPGSGTNTDIRFAPIYQDAAMTVPGIDPGHDLTAYPIAYYPNPGDIFGDIVHPIGFGNAGGSVSPRIGTEIVDGIAPPALNTLGYGWFDTGNPSEVQLIGGDSGSPTLMNVQGQTVLTGIHLAAAGPPDSVSIDSYLGFYRDSIEAKEIGVTFRIVPEPSRAALLLLGGAIVLARRRR